MKISWLAQGNTMAVTTFYVILLAVVVQCQDRVRLVDITALTLARYLMTTGRRTPPIPQMRCVGGCEGYEPKTAQCYNRGHQGRRVQWNCVASFPYGYRFGRVRIECEGYDSPEDEYVLSGSCGMEYTLEHSRSDGRDSTGMRFSDIILIVVIGIIVIGLCLVCVHRSSSQGGYIAAAPQQPGFIAPNYAAGPYAQYASAPYASAPYYGMGSMMGGRSGPGFFTGAATGGLVGYLLGSNYNEGHRSYLPPPSYQETGGGFIEDNAFADTDMR